MGSITTSQKQVFCLNQMSQNKLPEFSSDDALTANLFLKKYIHIYLSEEPTPLSSSPASSSSSSWSHQSNNIEINWEELADILYNFRAIACLTLYQEVSASPSNPTKLEDFVIFTTSVGKVLGPLVTTDHLYFKTLKYFNGKTKNENQIITREDLMAILAGELRLFSIRSERLKRFEENFVELNSVWDTSTKNHRLSEAQVVEMVDQYYRSIIDHVVKSAPFIPPKDRLRSLPKFPEGISEGITLSSLPPLVARNTRSMNDSTNSLAVSSLRDYCLASRRGAIIALDRYGLTIRKWNQLLTKYSKLFPKVEEQNKKWINYLNSEEFEQKIQKYDHVQGAVSEEMVDSY
jgi:hypothetical protein